MRARDQSARHGNGVGGDDFRSPHNAAYSDTSSRANLMRQPRFASATLPPPQYVFDVTSVG